jgi:hypothetical protein
VIITRRVHSSETYQKNPGASFSYTNGGGGATRMRDGVMHENARITFVFMCVPNPDPKFLGVSDPEKNLDFLSFVTF